MPSGVFKPYSGVGTAALIFQKSKPTQSVWFYDLTADSYSLDDKRTPIEANDIPDVLAKWPEREEGPNSYRVPLEKIQANDWSLAAGRYKPVTTEAVNHDTPNSSVSWAAQPVRVVLDEVVPTKRGPFGVHSTWDAVSKGWSTGAANSDDQSGSSAMTTCPMTSPWPLNFVARILGKWPRLSIALPTA